jgi:hypothetical protein
MAVAITCLWYLDTEQGAEGLLSPMCSKVVCSRAGMCQSLAGGSCPLTVGYGDVLNRMAVHVMQNEPPYSVGEIRGQVVPFGEPRPKGYQIWFGRTKVFSSVRDAEA